MKSTISLPSLSFTLAAVASSALFACASPSVANAERKAASAAKIYAFESDANGFNTRNYFYDTGREVIAFDTQFTPALAEQSIAFLRTKSQNPITTLVITHPNPDKFNGIDAFKKIGARVISSRRTAESLPAVHAYKKYYFVKIAGMFSDATYPKLGTIDETFEDELSLKTTAGSVTLRELARPGVSTNQTVALIENGRAAIVGDLIHHGVHAWLEGGIVDGKPAPTPSGWLEDLRELSKLVSSDALIYGGRGDAGAAGLVIAEQAAYLKKADRLVSAYVAKLGARKSELSGPQAGKHYETLTQEFEREFPGRGLSYLIQYGSYGLLNSKL